LRRLIVVIITRITVSSIAAGHVGMLLGSVGWYQTLAPQL